MDFSKINELKPYDLNCNIFDVYSYDGLSMQELLCQFFTKINECVKTSNETIDLAEWLVNEGLKQEVALKLSNWLNDGTFENLINVTLFENLNKKVDYVSSQLEHIVNINIIDFKTADNTWDNAISLSLEKAKKYNSNQYVKIMFPFNCNIELNSTINGINNVIFDLNDCTIKKGNVADFHIFSFQDVENIILRNGKINGNGHNVLPGVNGRICIFSNCKNVKIKNMYFYNNKSYGVFFNNCSQVDVIGNKFINDDGTEFNNNLQFFASIFVEPNAKGSSILNIKNNYFKNVTGDNIVVGGVNIDSAIGKGGKAIIEGNIIDNPCSNSKWSTTGVMCGINIESGSSHGKIGFEDIIIANNIINDYKNSETLIGINISTSNNCICTNNIINNAHTGIYCYEQYDSIISNNSINNSRAYGINVSYIATSCIISNNNITNYANYGILLSVHDDDNYRNFTCSISNNIVRSDKKILNRVPYNGIKVADRPPSTSQTLSVGTGIVNLTGNIVKNSIEHYNLYQLDNRDLDLNGKPFLTINASKDNIGGNFYTSGIATIPAGSNTVNVSHGLSGNKPPKNIVVIPRHEEVSGIYVLDDSYASNSIIRFRCPNNVTVDREIYWYAESNICV